MSRPQSEAFAIWGWFFTLLYITANALIIPAVRKRVIRILKGNNRRPIVSYLIACIVGACLAALYLFIAREGIAALSARPDIDKEVPTNGSTPPKATDLTPLSLRHLFDTDINILSATQEHILTDPTNGSMLKVIYKLYLDFDSGSKFVSFYIQHSEHTFMVCNYLASDPNGTQSAINMSSGTTVTGGFAGEGQRDSRNLKFTGQVYIYHETPMSIEEQGDLSHLFSARGFHVTFRGIDWLTVREIIKGKVKH